MHISKLINIILFVALLFTYPTNLISALENNTNIDASSLGFSVSMNVNYLLNPGEFADNDKFAVYTIDENTVDFDLEPEEPINSNPEVLGINLKSYKDKGLKYKVAHVALPLYDQDYYWGKFYNGRAGTKELNTMPILWPGKRVNTIRDGYITVSRSRGYVQPPRGYAFGSGLCWSTSLLGAVMDKANSDFQAKYGMPLFIFNPGDRAPHGHWYKTYEESNNGYGYTVIKRKSGHIRDYSFTVNPEVKRISKKFRRFKLKIVLLSGSKHKQASHGQVLKGYILVNRQI